MARESQDDFIETKFHADLSAFIKQALATEGIDNAKIVKARRPLLRSSLLLLMMPFRHSK